MNESFANLSLSDEAKDKKKLEYRLRGRHPRIDPKEDELKRKMPKYDDNHRRPTPIENDDMDTAPAVTSRSIVTAQKPGRVGGGETAVENIPVSRFNPFPHTAQVIMPIYKLNKAVQLQATAGGAGQLFAVTVRLNSIYDCIIGSSYAADPTPSADTAESAGSRETPRMRKYWMGYYRYWTVVKTDYRVRVWLRTNGVFQEVSAYLYFHGQQFPPFFDTGTTTLVPDHVRRYHPGQRHKYVYAATASSGDTVYENQKVFTGTHYPGTIHNEVAEDEFHETWHKETEVPSFREYMTLLVQRSDRNADEAIDMAYDLSIDYTVQLKDLKAEYQYITQKTSIAAITDIGDSPTL